MSNKQKTNRILLIVLLVIVIAAILAGVCFLQISRLRKARLEARNPEVYIIEPGQGYSFPTDRWITVAASSTGLRLMESIEIWINGELIEIQETGLASGVGVIYGHFPLLVQEGAQTFVVRAIDVDGYVGQSEPVSITGVAVPEDQESYVLVPYNPERPLESISEEFHISLDQVIDLNPDIHTQPEGMVKVPVQPGEENIPASIDQIPADLISKNGYVSGKVCYPSQYIPEMTTYFENIDNGQYTKLPIALNQNTYGVSLPPGTYTAFAWLPDFSLGGSYSKAVPCGLTTSCSDHSPIKFQVKAGTSTTGIDICDWYDILSVPTAPGTPSTPLGPVEPQIASDIPMLIPIEVFPADNNGSLPFGVLLPLLPPGVPEHFAARDDGCKIRIGWNNPEPAADGYLVWLSSQTGIKQLAAKLKNGDLNSQQAWYEFTSPVSGLVSVWIEAYNTIGSTASSVKTLHLPSDCTSSPNDDLELQALELNIGGGFENVYLYLSVEGIAEERLPDDDSSFLAMQEGSASLASGATQYTLPKPDDGSLSISGECWGWAGDTPTKISSFDISVPESDWSGFNTDVGNENCSFAINLKKKEKDISTYQTMNNKGSSVPPPKDVSSVQNKWYQDSSDPSEEWSWFWERQIVWKWPHDHKLITGFSIYADGKLLKTVPATVRNGTVILPHWCGDKIDWKVVANAKKGGPASSQIHTETLPFCPKYAEVVFESMHIYKSCDSCCCGGWANDTFEAYFDLSVNNVVHSFGSGSNYIGFSSGNIFFGPIAKYFNKPNLERFIVPVYKEPIELTIQGNFYDYDWDSSDDKWGDLYANRGYPTFQDALKSTNINQGGIQSSGKQYMDTANGNEVYYRIRFYQTPSTQ